MGSKSELKTEKMNCLIVDDEPLALDVIEDFIRNVPFLELTGRCTSAYEAIEIMRMHRIDLLFLDIQMPHLNGIDLIKSLENRPLIILTTAFLNYAVEGFDLGVVDYLVKPIEFNRFLRAVNKAYTLHFPNSAESRELLDDSVQALESQEYFLIRVEYSTIRVALDSILYIEGLKDYIKVYNGGKVLITKSTMHNVEERLPAGKFLRVHKSFIVALSKIEAIENNRILIAGKRIPIGDQYKIRFFESINKFRL
jgi:DNA-binding LytR/AlgR family response regulator